MQPKAAVFWHSPLRMFLAPSLSPACRFGGKDLLTIIKHKGGVAKHAFADGKWKAETEKGSPEWGAVGSSPEGVQTQTAALAGTQ